MLKNLRYRIASGAFAGFGLVILLAGFASPPTSVQRTDDRRAASVEWKRILAETPAAPHQLAARDALAKRQAAAAIALLRAGQAEEVWVLLQHSSDPSLRSYLVRDMGRSGVRPEVLVSRLEVETDVSVRRALILSLGAFAEDALPPATRSALVARLLRLYRDDPDAGVHSAVDWLLRHGRAGMLERALDWNQGEALRTIDRQLAGALPAGRNWFVTREGQTLALLHGPVEFLMGSPPYEPGRDKSPEEALHRVRIPRSFSIATKEVTVAQFQRFLDSNPEIKKAAQAAGTKDPSRGSRVLSRSSPDDDAPQVVMTWFEAAQYCNWLSRQDGIPQDEWCYPPLDQIKEGMKLPSGCLERTGYRLPTEAEWEFACRAGATTSRFYGSAEELLREYAWYTATTFDERSWPVGQLKPNDFGLFDMFGNVWEWGHDRWKPYPTDADATVREDVEDTPPTVSRDYSRPRRGGSFTYGASYLRCAQRGASGGYIPDERRDSVGFRIARTIR